MNLWMSLWDPPKKKDEKMDRALRDMKPISPAALKRAIAKALVTHCKHGTLRTEHCPWCYIETPAYRQSLAKAMWDVLD